MNKLKLTIGLIIVLLLTLVFTACSGEAIGVKGVTVDDNGNVIVEYADGSTQAFGTVAIPEPEKPVTMAIREVAAGQLTGTLKEEYLK